ncbi:hypothetical protein IFM89_030835 [Coptis chinensis]|uniref:PTC1-like winged helix-turn-helix domain-containing protein n=1 Tax=Coptis chinensis TaxID=261450 RepID=A0A835IHM7_9MAGN|nr:hypothetical protein IFM89_030835 [Coptis chinensis]
MSLTRLLEGNKEEAPRSLSASTQEFLKHFGHPIQFTTSYHYTKALKRQYFVRLNLKKDARKQEREESEGKLKGILGYIKDDVVSTDFIDCNRNASRDVASRGNLGLAGWGVVLRDDRGEVICSGTGGMVVETCYIMLTKLMLLTKAKKLDSIKKLLHFRSEKHSHDAMVEALMDYSRSVETNSENSAIVDDAPTVLKRISTALSSSRVMVSLVGYNGNPYFQVLQVTGGSCWVPWRALKGAACRLGSSELLDYYLKVLGGKVLDDGRMVLSRCNPELDAIEYK